MRGDQSFDEALHVEDLIKWEQAMDDEMRSHEKNDMGVDWVTCREESFAEQVGVQNQDWTRWQKKVQGSFSG